MKKDMIKSILVLTVTALLCSTVLYCVHKLTQPLISMIGGTL
ncbi:MAG: hypothetical protein PHS45_03195 [Bacilli bacterium]|nr:hypothetical protein [Bacilli bacterium]